MSLPSPVYVPPELELDTNAVAKVLTQLKVSLVQHLVSTIMQSAQLLILQA